MVVWYGIVVIEDVVYNDLVFYDEFCCMVKSFDDGSGYVMLCDLFIKMVVLGLCLGWVEVGCWIELLCWFKNV